MNAIDYIIGIVFLIVYFIFSHLGDTDDTTNRFSILIFWLVALGVSFLFGMRLVSSIYGHFLTSNESVVNFSFSYVVWFLLGSVIFIPYFSIQLARAYYPVIHEEFVVRLNPGTSRVSTMGNSKVLTGHPLMLLLPLDMLYNKALSSLRPDNLDQLFSMVNRFFDYAAKETITSAVNNGQIAINIIIVIASLIVFWFYHKRKGKVYRRKYVA